MWKILFPLALLTLIIQADEQPETAWAKDRNLIIGGPFVYGSLSVPPDLFRHLLPGEEDDADSDPFGSDAKGDKMVDRDTLDKYAPIIPIRHLPRCLPALSKYRDLSQLLISNGIDLADKEWALVPSGLDTDSRIYFCTTIQNAEIIEQLFLVHYRNRRSVSQLVTLVSTENQKLSSTAWTLGNLTKLNPTIHARYGIQCRSGERTTNILSLQKNSPSEFELEPTIGENSFLLDCRLYISCSLPEPLVSITQNTAIATDIKNPFVIDCGSHGEDLRNYFLVLHSSIMTHVHDIPWPDYKNLQNIEGIYAKQSLRIKPAPHTYKFTTHSYRAGPRFLEQLRNNLNQVASGDNDDPFARTAHSGPTPPVLVEGLKANKHYKETDNVFDITPQVSKLGVSIIKGERVYFNRTKNRIVIHGSHYLHSQAARLSIQISLSPRQIKLAAHIVNVDHVGLKPVQWSLEKIKQANPVYLKKYGTSARSGERTTYGTFTIREEKDPESDIIIKHYDYEFEVEPTISSNEKHIDLRYAIRSQPLGKSKLKIEQIFAVTMDDGKPTIIELGHPNSGERTHLLILHADIITSDGSFYRDRFKPIK